MAGLAFLLGFGVRFGVFPPFCGGLPFSAVPESSGELRVCSGFRDVRRTGFVLDGLSEFSGRPLFDVRGVASLAGESVPVMLVVARTTKPFALQSWLVTSKYT